jgi:hypothetical protein
VRTGADFKGFTNGDLRSCIKDFQNNSKNYVCIELRAYRRYVSEKTTVNLRIGSILYYFSYIYHVVASSLVFGGHLPPVAPITRIKASHKYAIKTNITIKIKLLNST